MTDRTFDDYSRDALATAIYPYVGTGQKQAVSYTIIGLAGEAGEVANKFKKVLRGDKEFTEEVRLAIAKEIGGVLWYAAALANELGLSLSYIAEENIRELHSRQARGTVMGDGDNR